MAPRDPESIRLAKEAVKFGRPPSFVAVRPLGVWGPEYSPAVGGFGFVHSGLNAARLACTRSHALTRVLEDADDRAGKHP